MKVAILGFGREGKSVLRFLQNRGLSRISARINADEDIWILDQNPKTKVPRGIKSQLGKNWLKNLEWFDLVFRSPGIPYNLPELQRARRAGTKFSSATKLFFEKCPAQIIGITGTKGKGTTATLLYKILKAAHRPALLAGNIGTSTLDLLPRLKKNSVVILELSSFQLQDLKKSPHVAVVLDIFPDHQDAHLDLKEYYEAKTNIARHQKTEDKIFFFRNHHLCGRVASKSRGKKIAVDEKKFKLFKPADLKMPGFHNFKNAVMAAAVAQKLGIPGETIIKTIKNFRGLEHRLEFVRRIRINSHHSHKHSQHSHYISFYNDSASTNPHTTAAAIKAFPTETKILIAGGQDKNLDYAPLVRELKNFNTKLVVLFGENKRKIARAILRSRKKELRIKVVNDLRTAVAIAYRFAQKPLLHASYFVILFSPGAASFDMFKNYADRGQQFKKIVKGIK